MHQNIEKSTITLTRAALLLIGAVGFTITMAGQWFTTTNAMERGFERIENKINNEVLKINNRNELLNAELENVKRRQSMIEAITTQRVNPPTNK
jgi:hypothetical protein